MDASGLVVFAGAWERKERGVSVLDAHNNKMHLTKLLNEMGDATDEQKKTLSESEAGLGTLFMP
jgi:hypothetical protein